MIDTHCHLFLEQFDDDIDEVLQRAHAAGVTHILMPAIYFGSLSRMDELKYPNIALYKMAGIHPTKINEGKKTTGDELLEYCSNDDIVAVGETGLDYYWSDDYKTEQKRSLRIHCKVAKELDKPIVLHNTCKCIDEVIPYYLSFQKLLSP